MNSGGIANRLINVFNAILGPIRGSLGLANVAINVFMAGISGSGIADCAATGGVLIPAMKKAGYPAPFAAALTAAAAVCGPLVPPSIAMVIYAIVARISILELFVAGYIPGFILGVCLAVYVVYVARRRGYPAQPKVPIREFASQVRSSTLAL